MKNQHHHPFLENSFLSYLFILFFMISANHLNAQDGKESCATDQLHLKLLKENESYKLNFEKNNAEWQQYAQKHNSDWKPQTNKNGVVQTPSTTTLTVVFHDMQGIPTIPSTPPPTSLISNNYTTIVNNLNNYFAGSNGGGVNTYIQFCLAQQNVQGNNYTDLKTCHYTTITSLNKDSLTDTDILVSNSNSQSYLAPFPTNKYINIYVVDDILGSVAGFATLPSSHGYTKDGIFIERQWLLGTNSDDIKILVHEMGHYLGLFHVFGICDPAFPACSCDNNNCLFNGDMVCDTPPSQKDMTNTCNNAPGLNTCSTDGIAYPPSGVNVNPFPIGADVPDFKNNYMDYSNDQGCLINFTQGQVTRMQFMIDPLNGPRKSLLQNNSCSNCIAMDGCSFTISPSSNMVFNATQQNYEVQQVADATPTITFSTSPQGCLSSTPNFSYTWKLIALDSGATIETFSSSNATYAPTISLIATGNYKLELTASISESCSKTASFLFQVIPTPDPCNLTLPIDNTNWGSWNRVAYTGGWSRSLIPPYDFYFPNTRQVVTTTHDGFDIITPSTLTNGSYDPNFAGLPMPSGATFDKVIRVGRKIDAVTQQIDGDAHYASVVFNPTKKNCKYRVYYLGVTNITTSTTPISYDNFNAHQNSLTSFGLLCQYKYHSPVSNTNSIMGMTENGYYLSSNGNGTAPFNAQPVSHYGLNDMIFGKHHSDYSNTADVTIASVHYLKTTAWKYVDLDFSEFVDLNNEGLNTQITVTLYSRTNDNTNASSHSYAYYAIECLGGGIPKDIDVDYPDILTPCQYNSSNCIIIKLPKPKYIIKAADNSYINSSTRRITNYYINYNPTLAHTGNFTSYTVEYSNDNISFSPYMVPSVSEGNATDFLDYSLKICKNQSDSPFIYFRVTIKTLHKTLVKTFKYFNGFYYNNLCPNQTNLGGSVPNGVSNSFTYCLQDTTSLPTLTLTPPCYIPLPGQSYTYSWTINNMITIDNVENLNLANLSQTAYEYLANNCAISIYRRASINDPYCNSPIIFDSQAYAGYNLTGYKILYEKKPKDLCLRGQIVVDINNFHIDNQSLTCIPPNLIPSGTYNNYVELQLIGPAPNYHVLGTQTISYNPLNSNNYNLTFDLNNYNATNNSYFLPLGNQIIYVRLIRHFNGCTTTDKDSPFNINVRPTALGGTIQLNNSCNNSIDITSADIGATSSIYEWQYSNDSSFPNNATYILPNQTGATITGLNIASFSLPLYIRRKSFGYPNTQCSDDVYSENYITVNDAPINPTFTFDSICKDAVPPALTSTNGITGTWTLAGAEVATINTSTAGTFNYTFTPDSGQCTSAAFYNVPITITNNTIPTFNPMPTVCIGGASPLVTTSTNGISGTWSPQFSNTISQPYTFNPTSGVCPKTVTTTITVLPKANFTIGGSYCVGAPFINLPNHDSNNIDGVWTHNNVPVTQINTTTIGTSDYIFTPTTPNTICENYVLPVTITTTSISPTFSFSTNICYGVTSTALPTISDNGIVGHWVPANINTTQSITYHFTPNPNQCALPTSIAISVIENCGITLSWGSEVSCQVGTIPDHGVKDYDANIADGPCIRVCENSTITYTLAGGGIGIIDHTDWFVTGGTASQDPQYTNNTTCTITWGTASYCALQGIIYLNNGTTLQINKCIEKLATPIAQFGILPNMEFNNYTECINNPIHFENTSYNNGGNDVLYYNWDFGDGTTSNEFEPSHTYTELGEYTVILQVFNGCSCSSKYEIKVKIIDTKINIQCPSVVCEGERTSYSIDYELGKDCTNLQWNVVGGHQLGHNDNNTQIDVVWDNVDQDGFGYISVSSSTCFHCSTPVKIPIIKQKGTIIGNESLCPKSQGTYALPQWPSTIFNWTINDGGTGAIIINNNNRNEIIVQSQSNGTIQLFCTYFNTLLGCGGSAQYTIHVKPFARLEGPYSVCKNKDIDYNIINEIGNGIPTINWTIDGPNGYTYSGTQGNFTTSFPAIGTYNFTINDTNYCSQLTQITVKEAPVAPTTITGPLVVCPGIPVTYSCPPSTDAVTHWVVVGGHIIGSTTGNTITVNFDAIPSALTTYTVKVWYEGELCKSDTLYTTIHRDVPVFSITAPNATVCGSTTMSYSTAYTTGENYVWSISPETAGSVQAGQNTPNCTILWNQATSNPNPIVKLEIRKCGATYPATYNVHVINHPDITIQASTAICSNDPFLPEIIMSVGTSYDSVTWDYGDGTIETILYPNVASHNYLASPSPSSNFTVVATVHGGNGCLADATNHLQITVATSPIVDLNLPDATNICNNHNSTDPIFEASVNVQSGFSATNIVQWYRQDGTGTHVIPAPQGNAYVINVSNIAQGFGAGTYWATVTNVYNCTSTTGTFDVIDDCGTASSGTGGPGGPGCNCTYDFDATYPCQSVQATISNPSCNLVATDWSYYPQLPSDIITTNTTTNFSVTNLQPGKYKLRALMNYNATIMPCLVSKETDFIIPYKADVRYNVTCNNNSNYDVTILDHSVYYPLTPITKYEFTTNGFTWIDQGTATAYFTTLAPGTYTIGVRISHTGYTPCIATVTLVLPDMPSAALSHAPYACQSTAMQFNALDSTPGLQYEWHFPNNAVNLQQNPVRTFNGSGSFGVTLTVTNQYGCFATSPMTSVQVKQVNMVGKIDKSPITTCEGNNLNLNYNTLGTTMPTNFTWYHNEVTNPAYANTTIPNISINQSGQYFAYVQDSNGCYEYKNPAVSVAFIPLPATPVIKGSAIACAGSPIQLSIPNDPTMSYEWSILNNGNNVVNPAWHNLTAIQDVQTMIGNYTYSVVAKVANTGTPGAYCSSNAGTFTVNVVADPDLPELKIEVASCIPYRVKVSVVNPQNGVNYHWSNGYTGLETMITHDGPLQVRAEVFNCSVTAQVDLPRDLTALAWTFPRGCYVVCTEQPLGYLVGPLGIFKEWDWIEDNIVIDTDHDSNIRDLHDLQPNSAYQLHLYNEYCDTTLGTVEITQTECKECTIEYSVKDINCINIDGVNLYAVTIDCTNPYGTTAGATLSVAGGEGYFDSSILQLPDGYSTQTILFNALNGFLGGDVTVSIQTHWKEEWCVSQLKINFPEDCTEVERCNFGHEIRSIHCIATPYGNIYDIEVLLTNPYPIQATTTLSVPNGEGYLVPATVQMALGTNTYHFNLYPEYGFNGGAVTLVFNSGFASYYCRKEGKFDFPELCTEPSSCEFEFAFTEPECQTIGVNTFSYQIDLSAYNPSGDVATMTLMAPNGEGYFVSNNLLLPANASNQTFYFYPTSGFQSGDVTVTVLVHFKDGVCYSQRTLTFENCCILCPNHEKIGETTALNYNVLRIAPNPAKAVTTIFYNFVKEEKMKTIELTDLLGRTLQSWTPTEASGKIELDCTVYANGQYLILMKEDNKIIETAKLITN